MTRSSLKNLWHPLVRALTPFWEHLFDITAAIDVMDGGRLDGVSTGVMGDYIVIACAKKRRQMPFEIFICIWKRKLRALDSLQDGCLITFRAQLRLYFCLRLGLPSVSPYHVYVKTPSESLSCPSAKSNYCSHNRRLIRYLGFERKINVIHLHSLSKFRCRLGILHIKSTNMVHHHD